MNFFESGKIKRVSKGTILLHQGDVCQFGCKVIKGCLKSFVRDDTGKEHIIQFAPEGWLITDLDSLLNHTPSRLSIEAIEDCEVHWLQGKALDVWENTSREELLQQIGLLTRHIITANRRIGMLLSSTAEERYLDFIQTYPTLTQRLPLKLIAAYIGVTPEYLSEIRRKFVGK